MAKQLRAIQDAVLLTSNTALPNAANTVNTNGIDLGVTQLYPATEKVMLKVITGQSTGANSKNITLSVQDSADNSTFANIATLGATVIAGNAANYPSSVTNVALPPGTRRYVRVSATGEANGGNAADNNLTAQIVF